MERITGPYNGFYLATYASDVGGPGIKYLGYAKICRGRPDNYFDAHCCAKVCGEKIHTTADAALAEAETRAREQTGSLAAYTFAPVPAQPQTH